MDGKEKETHGPVMEILFKIAGLVSETGTFSPLEGLVSFRGRIFTDLNN